VPEAPSIWRSTFVKHLQRNIDADLVDFDQCSAGAESKKPTCLMAVNLPQLRSALRSLPGQGFCAHGRKGHKAVLKGLAEDGTWRTAPAKQYPSGMCNAVSDAVLAFVQNSVNHNSPGDRLDLPSNVSPFYTPLDPYCAEHTFGAYGQDFAFGKIDKDGKAQHGKHRRTTHKPWLLPQNLAPGDALPTAVALPAAPPAPAGNDPALAYLNLTDAQIDRIAENRRRALEIRRKRRLDWLHTFSRVSHVSASPENVEQTIRSIPRVRTGATVRSRFVFGGKPKSSAPSMDLVTLHRPSSTDIASSSHLTFAPKEPTGLAPLSHLSSPHDQAIVCHHEHETFVPMEPTGLASSSHLSSPHDQAPMRHHDHDAPLSPCTGTEGQL